MPKINFNVPYLTSHGEPIRRPKTDTTKAKLDQNGAPHFEILTDAEGLVVFEIVTMSDMLVQVLDSAFEGDDKLSFNVRADRGKLARKVSDKTLGSLKNYSIEELSTIKELSAKIAAPALIAQLDDIIEGKKSVDGNGNEAEVAA